MKKINLQFLIPLACFLFIFFLIPNTQAAIDGHLRIISPNGGEVYTEDDYTTITWDASDNIDKVSIGYSTGPGSLNWIAFTAPNTGSYTWKVDVGNTTKTSFVISMTGYETGKGSLSDKSDGWFTVNQKSEFPPAPAPTPEPEPAPIKTTPLVPEPIIASEPEPEPVPVPSPSPEPKDNKPTVINIEQTTIISLTQIVINQYFFFENSKTTDLSKVDPKNVENFTLDRLDLMYFSFLGITDMSEPKDAEVINNLDEMVYMDYYYFWFEWEFWLIFETDIECTFYDTADTLSADSPLIVNNQELAMDEYKIETLANNEKKVTISPEVIKKYATPGEKIEIALKPSLQVNIKPNQNIIADEDKFTLEGSVSNTDSKIIINYNGEKIELVVNQDGGFKKILSLEEGSNSIAILAYEKDAKDPFTEIKGTIEYQKKSEKNWLQTSGYVMLGIFITLILIFLLKKLRPIISKK